ncbi:MAG: DNA polymerase I [Candidatus Melainabacteria bacterium]|nr:DNA polymerase I [Candidatus Melainabacteria bacterium]
MDKKETMVLENGSSTETSAADEKETLVLVDGSSLAYRSFFALLTTGMRTKTGIPTWAVMGFFMSLFDMIDRQAPHMLAICFDVAAPTFRKEEFAEYKANRLDMPDDLAAQWPLIKRGVEALQIPILEIAGFEADDVIGTVAIKAAREGRRVQILTGDKDAFQLVGDEHELIEVLMPGKNGLGSYKKAEVFAKMGVWPEQIIDYKALCGDNSDNIPGVKGIGPVTAVKLLTEYKTLEAVYENVEALTSKSIKAKLIEGRESAFQSQRLARIVLDVPIDFCYEKCRLVMPDIEEAGKFFKSLQFRSLINRLPICLAKSFSEKGEDIKELEKKLKNIITALEVEPISYKDAMGGDLPEFASGADDETGETTGQEHRPAPAPAIAVPDIVLTKFVSPVDPIIVINEEGLDQLISALFQQSVISLSIETDGTNSLNTDIIGWAFAWGKGLTFEEDGSLVANADVPLSDLQTAYVPVRHRYIGIEQLAPDVVADRLKPILEDKQIGKVAQDAKFVMNVLSRVGITLAPVASDPMLASYIRDPDDKHSLRDQADRLLGYNPSRITDLIGTGKKQIEMAMAPVLKVAPYSADDARITLELTRYYAAIFDEEQRYLLYQMDLPLLGVLARMEQAGVALDRDYLKKLSEEMLIELTRLEKEIFEISGHTFNISSTQQLQKVLFDELGLKTKAKTKTGAGYSTDASVLESLKDEHVIIPKILEYRHLTKLRSTYVEALPKEVLPHDSRLHGEFNQTVAATGRLSSSNPNLQNIPIRSEVGRKIRRAFVTANDDSSLISADYSQIELRMLAHMSGDENLIDAFEKNQDIHARTAMEIFDVPLESVDKNMRSVGKTLNFALIYQQGPFATAQSLGISTKEAQAYIDKYFSRYPKVKGFMTKTVEEARINNYVSTLWGRRRYFANLADRNTNVRRADERAACNAPLQGSAADLMKLAMLELDRQLQERGSKAKLVLQVHDELVLEVPNSELESISEVVRQSMELNQPLSAPLRVDVSVGKTWIDAK